MPVQNEGKTQEARARQRAGDKRATFDQLAGKKRAEEEITVSLSGNGTDDKVTLLFRAIGTREYDKLLGKHPPKAEQKVEGASYNIDSFGPALIAKCAAEPELTEAQSKELWESDDWSRGEIMTLFRTAVEVCNRGLDVPFTAPD